METSVGAQNESKIQYQNMDIEFQMASTQAKPKTVSRSLCFLTIFFLFVVALIAIIFAALFFTKGESTGSNTSNIATCVTSDCIDIAGEVQDTLNTNVDPCDDFYEYVCGGWEDTHEYELFDTDAYTTLSTAPDKIFQETLLDEVTYYTDPEYVNQDSIAKLITFTNICMNQDNEDPLTIQSEQDLLFNNFINNIIFDTNIYNINYTYTWNDELKQGFRDALVWSLKRDLTSFFGVSLISQGAPLFTQDYKAWGLGYNANIHKEKANYNKYVIPFFKTYLNYTDEQINDITIQIWDTNNGIISQMIDITTADYWIFETDMAPKNYTLDHSEIHEIFNVTDDSIIDYGQLILNMFNNIEPIGIVYHDVDPEFFNSLNILIGNTSPDVIQVFMYTDMILNFVGTWEQPSSQKRREFCFNTIKEKFPFLYAYTLHYFTKTDADYAEIAEMINNILESFKTKFTEASWLNTDSESLSNALLKVEHMAIYIGIPENMKNITILNEYYDNLTLSDNDFFMNNYEALLEYDNDRQMATYTGVGLPNLFEEWPDDFKRESGFNAWLTGTNAFYSPVGNYFVIPNTVTVKPYFDINRPKVLNYGGIGAVIGHEISHGFDPTGSLYDYKGDNIVIYSNTTSEKYNDLVQCFIDEYTDIAVPVNITVNGNITINENVADNGGTSVALHAYNIYKSLYDIDSFTLPGVGLTESQLFWYSWGRSWCSVWRPNYFAEWTDVHAPYNQRANGVVMNSYSFSDSYQCSIASNMNPINKCVFL